MRTRLMLATALICVSAGNPAHAGPTYHVSSQPPPGPGGLNGNVQYDGPNNFSGILQSFPPGIVGVGTPLNSGNGIQPGNILISYNGISGAVRILSLSASDVYFEGRVVSGNVGEGGGALVVDGFLGPTVASFFGVSASTEQLGTFNLQLVPAVLNDGYNKIGSSDFTFAPGAAVPEPSSLVLLGTGILGVLGYGLKHASRRRPA